MTVSGFWERIERIWETGFGERWENILRQSNLASPLANTADRIRSIRSPNPLTAIRSIRSPNPLTAIRSIRSPNPLTAIRSIRSPNPLTAIRSTQSVDRHPFNPFP